MTQRGRGAACKEKENTKEDARGGRQAGTDAFSAARRYKTRGAHTHTRGAFPAQQESSSTARRPWGAARIGVPHCASPRHLSQPFSHGKCARQDAMAACMRAHHARGWPLRLTSVLWREVGRAGTSFPIAPARSVFVFVYWTIPSLFFFGFHCEFNGRTHGPQAQQRQFSSPHPFVAGQRGHARRARLAKPRVPASTAPATAARAAHRMNWFGDQRRWKVGSLYFHPFAVGSVQTSGRGFLS